MDGSLCEQCSPFYKTNELDFSLFPFSLPLSWRFSHFRKVSYRFLSFQPLLFCFCLSLWEKWGGSKRSPFRSFPYYSQWERLLINTFSQISILRLRLSVGSPSSLEPTPCSWR